MSQIEDEFLRQGAISRIQVRLGKISAILVQYRTYQNKGAITLKDFS